MSENTANEGNCPRDGAEMKDKQNPCGNRNVTLSISGNGKTDEILHLNLLPLAGAASPSKRRFSFLDLFISFAVIGICSAIVIPIRPAYLRESIQEESRYADMRVGLYAVGTHHGSAKKDNEMIKNTSKDVEIKQLLTRNAEYWTQDFLNKKTWKITVEEMKNPQIAGDFNSFTFENPLHPKSVELRTKYKLDGIIENSSDDFDALIKIMHWTNSQWRHSPINNPEHNDALTILSEAATGKRMVCSAYGTVFIQACTALGFPSRGLGSSGSGLKYHGGHFQTEAWSNMYQKWILFDPTNDIIYFKGDIPLNASELVHEMKKGNIMNLRMFSPSPGFDGVHFNDCDPRGYFQAVTIDMHNLFFEEDYAEAHKKYPRLFWLELGTKYSFSLDDKKPRNYTSDASKLYFSLNQTLLQPMLPEDWTPEAIAEPQVKILMKNTMPYFSHYIVEYNGARLETKEDTIILTFDKHSIDMKITAVNTLGRKGIPSSILIKSAQIPFLEENSIADLVDLLKMFAENCLAYGLAAEAEKCFKKIQYYETHTKARTH